MCLMGRMASERGLKEVEWLKYAADREDSLPSILKHSGMRSYLTNVPYTKDDSFQVPNMVKRGQAKARVQLLSELSTQMKHAKSQFKTAMKLQMSGASTSDANHEKIGMPIFQKKLLKSNASTKSII